MFSPGGVHAEGPFRSRLPKNPLWAKTGGRVKEGGERTLITRAASVGSNEIVKTSFGSGAGMNTRKSGGGVWWEIFAISPIDVLSLTCGTPAGQRQKPTQAGVFRPSSWSSTYRDRVSTTDSAWPIDHCPRRSASIASCMRAEFVPSN